MDGHICIAVHPKMVQEIKQALMTLLEHPLDYGNKTININMFDWKRIADTYKCMYIKITE